MFLLVFRLERELCIIFKFILLQSFYKLESSLFSIHQARIVVGTLQKMNHLESRVFFFTKLGILSTER